MIYANDYNHHREAIELKKKFPKSKLILNVLDLARNCAEHKEILDDLSINFYFCDAITTISETVKKQMLSVFPHIQNMGVSVVNQPIKSIKPLNLKRSENLMCAGRTGDPNKRTSLAIQAALINGKHLNLFGPDDITQFLAPQYKNNVTYKGLVDDKKLNEAYNTHAAVLITSLEEGLNLVAIEALCSKTPVVCVSDMSTSSEFIPKEFICEPNPFSISDKIKYITSGTEEIDKILTKYSDLYLRQFSSEKVAFNITSVYASLI